MLVRQLSLCLAVGWALSALPSAQAEEFQFASYSQIGAAVEQQSQEIDRQEEWNQWQNQQIGELRAELAGFRRAAESAIASDGAAGSCGCGGSSCCQSSCCPSCDCCINPVVSPRGWYAFGEASLLRASWKGLPAAQVNVTTAGVTNRTAFEYNYNYEVTPRVWVGYVGCNGLGVRANWWLYTHNSTLATVTAPAGTANLFGQLVGAGTATGSTLTTQQSLRVQTGDAEATNTFEACGGDFIGAFGLRYAQMVLSGRERTASPAGAAGASANYSSQFQGLGPTFALEFVRPLGCSRISLYSGLRASLIFGDARYQDTFFNAAGAVTATNTQSNRDTVGIGDMKIGLQYSQQFGNYGLFARGGWESQYWNQVAQVPFFTYGRITSGSPSLSLNGFFGQIGVQY